MERWTPPVVPSRLLAERRSPLVGRSPELAMLDAAWSLAETGVRQVVFVGGEPGAGKTRLAAEVAAVLADHDVGVLVGTSRAEDGVPYQPFAEMVDDLLRGAPTGSLSAVLDGIAPEIRRLSRHVDRHVPEQAASSDDASDVRRDLFDAIAELFRRLVIGRPLALILEDLHWAQPPTLALLEHVVVECADCPILIVGTFRTTLPDRSDGLATHMANLHRFDGVKRLDLSGLDTDAIVDFVRLRGVTRGASLREVAALLRDKTGGNPFFLREMISGIDATGTAALFDPRRPVPATVGAALGERLDGLGIELRRVLAIAAVLGDVFDLVTLIEASDADRSTTLAAVDGSQAVGLVEQVSDRDGVYCFVHSLARQTVLDRMTPHALAAAHACAAEVLERRDDPATIPSLANHFLAAHILGFSESAILYSERAGRQAEASLAYEDAARWFERAAALPECESAQRASLYFAAASNHLRAGDFAMARHLYERLTTMPDPLTRLDAAVGYEDANWRPGLADSRPADLLANAIDDCDLDDDDPRYVRALASLGRGLAFAGETARARAVGERAIELARKLGEQGTIDHALKTSLWHGLVPEVADVQLARATEVSESALRRRDYELLGAAAHFRCVAAYLGGHPDALSDASSDLRRASESSGQTFFTYVSGCVDHGRALLRGDIDEARRWAEATLRTGDRLGVDHTEGSHGVQMFMIHRITGELEQFRAWINGQENFEGRWVAGLLAVYTELGMVDGMRRALDRLTRRDLRNHTSEAQWPMELAFMIEAALAAGDRTVVELLRPYVASFSDRNIVAGQFVATFGSGDRYLGQIAAFDGDEAETDARFRAALEMDRRMGSVIHEAETLARWGLAEDSFGRPDHARELADRARGLADAVGHLRITKLLEPLSPSRAPDNLTDREVEVLRLLASGLSNREIGQQLFISSHTVANHVRNILMKTQAANRTQAAMYATDHHLT